MPKTPESPFKPISVVSRNPYEPRSGPFRKPSRESFDQARKPFQSISDGRTVNPYEPSSGPFKTNLVVPTSSQPEIGLIDQLKSLDEEIKRINEELGGFYAGFGSTYSHYERTRRTQETPEERQQREEKQRQDALKTLGLDANKLAAQGPEDQEVEIRRAYRKLAKELHPDRLQIDRGNLTLEEFSQTPEAAEASGKFNEIHEAYEILTKNPSLPDLQN